MLQEGDNVDPKAFSAIMGAGFGVIPMDLAKFKKGLITVYDKSIYTPAAIGTDIKKDDMDKLGQLIGTNVDGKDHGPKHVVKSSFSVLRHKKNGQNVLFVNAHADFTLTDTQVADWLTAVKAEAASQGMLVVIGGDFNRRIHEEAFVAHKPLITGLPTNVASAIGTDGKMTYDGRLTIEHAALKPGGTFEKPRGAKTYDAFFVGNEESKSGLKVEAAKVEGGVFCLAPTDGIERINAGSASVVFDANLKSAQGLARVTLRSGATIDIPRAQPGHPGEHPHPVGAGTLRGARTSTTPACP